MDLFEGLKKELQTAVEDQTHGDLKNMAWKDTFI